MPSGASGPGARRRLPLRLPLLLLPLPLGRHGRGAGAAGPSAGVREAVAAGRPGGARLRAWAELLRVSALFTVPGDALAGAAATGLAPNRRTALAIGSSLCLYEAGMALNDWADRHEDALDRPHRPLPSGRITPRAALAASATLTAAGLALAARAGRGPFAVASALATTVWAYDLRLKHTRAAPATMAAARALDLLLGATATAAPAPVAAPPAPPAPPAGPQVLRGPGARRGRRAGADAPGHGAVGSPARGAMAALPSAAALGAHTWAVTAVSRHEAQGGSSAAPLAALVATAALGAVVARPITAPYGVGGRAPKGRGGAARKSARWGERHERPEPDRPSAPPPGGPQASRARRTAHDEPPGAARHAPPRRTRGAATGAGLSIPPGSTPGSAPGGVGPGPAAGRSRAGAALAAAAYVRTAAVPLLHAALNPSAPLTQRAVGGGIRAMIPLQAALAARRGTGGALATGLAVLGLAPLARALARTVSPT
ncbi:SCO3242 family prenyltransferase [Streptomyces sp. NRRL S-118]|uniref:SCO3242 family prenyltransferase n=1 Tax=Streptomyces sp. NRRL S-118 TaxID=1463881 RepID=UPI001F3026DE|nr:UbiA family prenyltransferase [Streptomyces sp. NRRL S-118]